MERHHDIARYISEGIDSLLLSRKLAGKGRFSDTDEKWGLGGRVGHLASMQGLRTVFGAAAALGKDNPSIFSVIEPHKSSLLDEWKAVLETLGSNKYLPPEYDPTQGLSKILGGESRFYLESVSWSLSTCILVHYVARNWPDFFKDERTENTFADIRREMVRALKILLESQCSDGGWHISDGIEKGHLYFTWSVTQGFADLGDYVLGESEDELGLSPDADLVGYLEKELPGFVQQLKDSKERAIRFLTDKYLGKACTKGLSREDLADHYIQLENTKDVPEATLIISYCEAYLLECLILLGYDVGRKDRQTDLDRLYVRLLDKMPALSDPVFADDADLSTLHFKLTKQLGGRLGTVAYDILDGGLWPQILRSMILFKFYTKKERELDELLIGMSSDSPLTLLMKSRRDVGAGIGDGLWDTSAFNLSITARAIEGLIDCYDYYKMIGPGVQAEGPGFESSELAKIIADAIFPYIGRKIAESPGVLPEIPTEAEGSTVGLVTDENLNAKLIALMDAATAPLEDGRGIDTDIFLETLLGGPLPSGQLRRDNGDAYKLLKKMVTVSFFVSALLFDRIVTEAIIYSGSQKELNEQLRRREYEKNSETSRMHERIRQVLNRLATLEADVMKDPKTGKPPDYLSLIQPIMTNASGIAARKR